jgi:Ca2+/H+ antiporter
LVRTCTNFFIASESGLLAISYRAAIVLLVMFSYYLYFCYYTYLELTTLKHFIKTLIYTATFTTASLATFFTPSLSLKQQLLKLQKACLSKRGNKLLHISNILIVILLAALMVLSSIFMLKAIDLLSKDIGVSKSFVRLIVVPIIIGAAKHVTIALCAYKRHKDKIK